MTEPAYDLPWDSQTKPDAWTKARESIKNGQVVGLTADGERVAEIVPMGFVDGLEETVEILSDNEAVQALLDARRSIEEGDVVKDVDAVRGLLDHRK